jgi:hypothetical protein
MTRRTNTHDREAQGHDRPTMPLAISIVAAVTTFSAIIDTGGPITLVARELLTAGGDRIDLGRTMVLRLEESSC